MDHTFAANIGAYETWEFAMQDTPQSAPCLDCGSTGGYTHPRHHQPDRTRDLCATCAMRHRRRGTITDFPLQGYSGSPYLPHPAPLPDRLTLTSSREPWGAPHQPEWQACAAWERQDTADRWPTCQPCERRGVA